MAKLLRARYLVDVKSYNRVRGVPFRAAEIERHILELMGETA